MPHNDEAPRFRDRREAGRRLADRLVGRAWQAPVVLGMPRGGVVVAAEVAAALGAPLDVIVVRKLGCPWQPELAIGAIAEGGARVENRRVLEELAIRRADLEAVAEAEGRELERRVARYRLGRQPASLADKTVILVDDGLATGATARAAVASIRARGAARVVLAVPVAPPDSVAELRRVADEVVALITPRDFFALGQFYADFAATSDDEVVTLLEAARGRTSA